MTPLSIQHVLQEMAKRSHGPSLASIRDTTFPEQDAFVMDPSRYLSAFCTRRAGKSNGLGLRYYRTLTKHKGAFCPYIALTRESAKNIMWDALQELDERFKIGAKFTVANLTVTVPGDGRIQLFGADMKNFIRRLKGTKSPGVGIDEAQDFGAHLEDLVDNVLGPTIIDYPDGWLALTGTAGPVPYGFFYDVTGLLKYGYKVHQWSIYDNPYIENARQFVLDLKHKKGWADDYPTLLREWGWRTGKSEWVLDLDALVYQYEPSRNHYEHLPASKSKWDYVLGVDLGSNSKGRDKDSIAVIGWSGASGAAYLVEEISEFDEGITDLAQKISQLIRRYDPVKIVMDTGALGKKIADEIRTRYAIPIEAAEKQRKFEYIEILNDALRTSRLFARQDSLFAEDCKRVKWDQESNILKISDHYHSDICDAVLYAYREALNWLHVPEVETPKLNTPEYYEDLEDEMEERAQNQYRAQESADEWNGWNQ